MSIISHEQFGKKSFPRGILILENSLRKCPIMSIMPNPKHLNRIHIV